MEKKKAPLSIRIFYWLTNIAFWLLNLSCLGAILFNILLYTNVFDNNMQLHAQLPVKVDFLEDGNLFIQNTNIKVELVEATTSIHFYDTPSFISKKVGLAIILVLSIFYYVIWIFRKFIKNVKNGDIFELTNIGLLKRLSYGLLALWGFAAIYSGVAYYTVVKHLEFENIKITNEFNSYSGLLFVALFIWILSHIFMTGVKLQKEQELTI